MNKKGFTLVELLAAVAIIALLLILIVPNVVSLFNKSIEETMKIEEGQAVDAASVYIRDNCGRTAIDSYNKQKCNTRVTDEKLENNEVYFCLKEVQGQKYIGDILLKGKTPCDGVIIYKYDSDDGKFSEGKAYLTCGDGLYTTEGATNYKEQFTACNLPAPETPSEPTPEPNPPVPVVPAESIFKVSIDNAGGTSAGYSQIYLKYGVGWYSDNAASNQITSLNTPVKTGYTFNGYYTGTNGTLEKVIDASGNIISGKESVFTSDGTLYANWISGVYRVALNDNGATTTGTKEIYEKYGIGWYDDINATNSISKITIPKKAGYTFNGYYTDEDGNETQVIDENGNIKNGNTTIFSNEVGQAMLHAKWKFLFKEFDFTGDVQIFTVPVSGNYKVEVWGAQGGSYIDDYYGGYGGYSKGDIYLSKDEILYIYVGGEGKLATWTNKGDVSASGGYNGGGNVRLSYPNNIWDSYFIRYGGSGGGATHIATSKGLLSTLINKKNDILIVAGGGGGYGGYYVNNKMNNFSSQGHGGGFKGVTSNSNYGAIGGTQTIAGYSAYDNSKGVASFGQGGSSRTSGFYVLGGAGGGGFFGGGAVDESASDNGAGGSGYIGNSKLKNKAMYCYDCEESNEVDTKTISINVSGYHQTSKANVGNGFAMITYIEE